ncbi:MAG: hypothetical protein V3573_01615 [Desulfovibrionaceae bacterium]
MTEASRIALNDLLENWEDNECRCKECFLRLKQHCEELEGACLQWHARPGITYSLRAGHDRQTSRDLFAMVDIIDDDPSQRWLSVCFYGDMVTDPEQMGDYVPGGLLGKDAICFDVDDWDEERLRYVETRLSEACAVAAQGEAK